MPFTTRTLLKLCTLSKYDHPHTPDCFIQLALSEIAMSLATTHHHCLPLRAGAIADPETRAIALFWDGEERSVLSLELFKFGLVTF